MPDERPADNGSRERHAPEPFSPYTFQMKRILDLWLSVLIMVFVFPWLFPLLCLLVLLDSGWPVFFVQERVGLNGRIFNCYKFRTMRTRSPGHPASTSRLGRFLRDSKLDELPQLFNVLSGEMSFVGPRPHMLSDHEAFSRMLGEQYHLRHMVKPGITGLAQIRGYEGRINSPHKLRGRIRLDLFYINNWSLGLELQIIFRTIWHIFKGILQWG